MKTLSRFKKPAWLVSSVLALAIAAYAVQTALPASTTLVLNNASTVGAGSLTLTFTACDASNGNSFPWTGKDVLLVQNSGGSAYTFSISPVADQYGGTNTNFATYSVAAGGVAAVEMKFNQGWTQSTGTINLACSNAAIKYAVLVYQ